MPLLALVVLDDFAYTLPHVQHTLSYPQRCLRYTHMATHAKEQRYYSTQTTLTHLIESKCNCCQMILCRRLTLEAPVHPELELATQNVLPQVLEHSLHLWPLHILASVDIHSSMLHLLNSPSPTHRQRHCPSPIPQALVSHYLHHLPVQQRHQRLHE